MSDKIQVMLPKTVTVVKFVDCYGQQHDNFSGAVRANVKAEMSRLLMSDDLAIDDHNAVVDFMYENRPRIMEIFQQLANAEASDCLPEHSA